MVKLCAVSMNKNETFDIDDNFFLKPKSNPLEFDFYPTIGSITLLELPLRMKVDQEETPNSEDSN